jgi:hypothetical protein
MAELKLRRSTFPPPRSQTLVIMQVGKNFHGPDPDYGKNMFFQCVAMFWPHRAVGSLIGAAEREYLHAA